MLYKLLSEEVYLAIYLSILGKPKSTLLSDGLGHLVVRDFVFV